MLSFSSTSKSLSQSAANTTRPTKVRASVGSSTSGSSANPKRRRLGAAGGRRGNAATRQHRIAARLIHGSCACSVSCWCQPKRSRSILAPFRRLCAPRATIRRPALLAESRLQPRRGAHRRSRQSQRRLHRRGDDLAPEMARDRMAVVGDQRRVLRLAARLRVRTAGAESAARRRIERARHVALQDDALLAPRRVAAPGSPTAAPACRDDADARTARACPRIPRCGRGTSPRPAWRCA